VISRCMQRHRHQEFIRFLNAVERPVPAGKVIHVILDNYAAHKHPNVRKWLARHPRWVFHFTPTSCSWLNAIEGFFARLTRRRLKHGTDGSLIAQDVMTQPPIGEVRLRTEAGEQVLPLEHENLYVRAVRRFHRATRGEDTPAATGENGVRSLGLALAVREAAHTGRRTAVDPASTG
jgi:predicted dehydrogenase